MFKKYNTIVLILSDNVTILNELKNIIISIDLYHFLF